MRTPTTIVVRLPSTVRRKSRKSRTEQNGSQGHHHSKRLVFYVIPRGLHSGIIQSYIVIVYLYCIVIIIAYI